jgi:hypothetical protein
MFRKLSALAMTLALAVSVMVASFDTAEAGRRHRGAFIAGTALGVLALGAMGARAYDRERCHRGPRQCRWVRGECYRDRWGDVECESGYEECFRPLYCD